MAYRARILLDSISPSAARLTTMELCYPRFIHAEIMTHRTFSRNAASSRAIPIEKVLAQVEADPAMPVWWGRNQKGMQAEEQLEGVALEQAKAQWLLARDAAVLHARCMNEWGAHKQIVNRILEPWCWMTTIVSATDWANFFWLRCHKDAQPELRKVAALALKAYHESVPVEKQVGEWHCPLIQPDEWGLDIDIIKKVSVARCARVSYLTHEGKRDVRKDLELFERLRASGHWSTFEHVAQVPDVPGRSGNFWGWQQYRQGFHLEHREVMTTAEQKALLVEMEALGVLVEETP